MGHLFPGQLPHFTYLHFPILAHSKVIHSTYSSSQSECSPFAFNSKDRTTAEENS